MYIQRFIKLAGVARNHIVRYMPEWDNDLNGACGVATFHLMALANKHGTSPTFVAGLFSLNQDEEEHGHCWIEYDGYIIDITAAQFDEELPLVHVVPAPDVHYIYDFKTNDLDEAYNEIAYWVEYPTSLRKISCYGRR
jgi:hypothetical protein